MSSDNTLRVHLSKRERDLLSEYGYPFEDFGAQLSRVEGTNNSTTLMIDPFYLDALLADVSRSAKEIDDPHLLDELDALCTEIEIQTGAQGYRP